MCKLSSLKFQITLCISILPCKSIRTCTWSRIVTERCRWITGNLEASIRHIWAIPNSKGETLLTLLCISSAIIICVFENSESQCEGRVRGNAGGAQIKGESRVRRGRIKCHPATIETSSCECVHYGITVANIPVVWKGQCCRTWLYHLFPSVGWVGNKGVWWVCEEIGRVWCSLYTSYCDCHSCVSRIIGAGSGRVHNVDHPRVRWHDLARSWCYCELCVTICSCDPGWQSWVITLNNRCEGSCCGTWSDDTAAHSWLRIISISINWRKR